MIHARPRLKDNLCGMSVDDILCRAIEREQEGMTFYEQAMVEVGPDARLLMMRLHTQQGDRIRELEALLAEMKELRDLAAPIAD